MEYWWILLSMAMGTLGAIHFFYGNYNFFQRRGVIYIPPIPILGAMAPVIFRRISFADFIHNNDVDIKNFFTKYTSDVIAMCVYGVKVDSMKDPTNKFYIYGKDISEINIIKIVFFRTFPRLWRILNLKLINKRVSKFFENFIRVTLATRDAEQVTHSDMIQLMMNIKDKQDRRKLNSDEITAQTFLFFFGGYETTSTTLSFAAYEIAANPEVQTRLQQEIDKILEESNSEEVTYKVINRLEYLDAVVKEVLRFYAPTFLERVCDKNCEFPPALPGEKPFFVEKGTICWIPVFAIHHDNKYYENPDKFYPERFLNNKMYDNSFCYMPFGLGPRMCLGNRFAVMKIKLLLFHLLARCNLKPCPKTILPLRFSKKDIIMRPEGGFWLNIQCRNKNVQPTST
ncbi:cytochrome P450 9e2-like [Cataglyphis hispanica]|uniref:cytochrome P450 9e2-like n=1 Tax=Cataglyphis hispanica TaxID=1086592 RepID=UPI00217FFC16|nr:cytochrome P450 9e2-like [Cataglyphis hispanica]